MKMLFTDKLREYFWVYVKMFTKITEFKPKYKDKKKNKDFA